MMTLEEFRQVIIDRMSVKTTFTGQEILDILDECITETLGDHENI